jgi:hypothetical protein
MVLAFSPDGKTLAAGGDAKHGLLLWNLASEGRIPGVDPTSLKPEQLAALWADLAGGDAGRAYQAVWTLAGAGPGAVAFLNERLKPIPAIDADRVRYLIAQLDDDRFAARESATRALQELGAAVEPFLRRALAGASSRDARQRLETLLAGAARQGASHPEERRRRWAVQVLETVGTQEARALLARLAKGAPTAPQTELAQAALQRLDRLRP